MYTFGTPASQPSQPVQHKLLPAHSHPGNKQWFDTMFSVTAKGGLLVTNIGVYRKTPTGFVPA